jgi:hypothetical protein
VNGPQNATNGSQNSEPAGHKKRRVEEWTRLPTKRMATACWAFILATASPPKAAPMLVFLSLQGTNKEIHQQLIHKAVWMAWGQFSRASLHAKTT